MKIQLKVRDRKIYAKQSFCSKGKGILSGKIVVGQKDLSPF